MKVEIEIKNGGYSDRAELTLEGDVTIGKLLYRFFSGMIAKIVVGKKRGYLKGLSLRNDWSVQVIVDGKVIVDSGSVTGKTDYQFALKMGLSDKGVNRFRQGMCELTALCLVPFLTDSEGDIRTGYLLNRDTLASQINDTMKQSAAVIAEKVGLTAQA